MTCLKFRRKAAASAFAAFLGLALPFSASAQGGQAAGPTSSSVSGADGPSTGSASPKNMTTEVEQHIRQLHDNLHITSAEQGAWDQFAQVMRENASRIGQAIQQRGTSLTTMSAKDNMQSYAQLAQVHAADLQRLATAFQSLYDTFPSTQKQEADSLFQNSTGRGPLPVQHSSTHG